MPRKVMTSEAGGACTEVTISVGRHLKKSRATRPLGRLQSLAPTSRIPRITRLMALAIKFQDMVDRGEVRDYADIARLGYVTRARVTQIMNLMLLAPDIQEQLLSSVSNPAISQRLVERSVRNLAAIVDWHEQRGRWNVSG